MKRRKFIRSTAFGATFISNYGFLHASGNYINTDNLELFCPQTARDIPIIEEVDVLVAGGSAAGVQAAVSASLAGAKVFLICYDPYLGEDICGTYRFWNDVEDLSAPVAKKIFERKGILTPLEVKKLLDDELLENGVEYLYSSYITDLLFDEANKTAGVVIVNRSGRQAIKAKTIIDATPRASLVRMAGTQFTAYPSGKQEFQFIVVGNQPEKMAGLNSKKMLTPVLSGDKKYDAFEVSLEINMADDSYDSFAKAEQILRSAAWDPKQVDSGDVIFQVPPDNMHGTKRLKDDSINIHTVELDVFRPKKEERIYVLGGCADISRNAAKDLLKPANLIALGERIGKAASESAKSIAVLKEVKVPGNNQSNQIKGDVGEILENLRPNLNKGTIPSELDTLPILGNYDVVVIGGGTSGAPAGIGAARHGAKTLVIDYLHGLGGQGTMGLIGVYYHGYKKGFTAEIDKGVIDIGEGFEQKGNREDGWDKNWKMEWFRRQMLNAGGEIWFGCLACGAFVDGNQVKGVVVATPFGRGVVMAHTIIDSTGSADVAIAAGAPYKYTDGNHIAVQGAGLHFYQPDENYKNSDWTFMDDSDVLDVWRSFILAKDKYNDAYDVGKLLQTRERRRIIGDFEVSVLDIYNTRTYPDTISIHESSFDTHGFTVDPFFSLKPPEGASIKVLAYVPFRSLLPRNMEGIIVTGLGVSAHRDAMPVIRMQACIQNQGYAVGYSAALAAAGDFNIRKADIKKVQKYLVQIGNLEEEVLTHKDNYPLPDEKIIHAAETITNNFEGLEILLWHPKKAVPLLQDKFEKEQNSDDKFIYAYILGMMGISDGWKLLSEKIKTYNEWDDGWNYRGMGQFGLSMSLLDSYIIALGKTKEKEAIPVIAEISKKLKTESEFSHFRAVAVAMEEIGNVQGADVVYDLLQLPDVQGYATTTIEEAKKQVDNDPENTNNRNSSLKEIVLARSLFKCGDKNGLGEEILTKYSNDLRGHYYRHASAVLESKKMDVEMEKEKMR